MAKELNKKVEHSIPCPPNPRWVAKMLAIYPPGVAKKLEPYRKCPNVAREIERILKEESEEE